ncbi:Histone-lysine N-methyltransferase protein [Dioscorea alata]|uniref:Histone-lysine N-methyltransferase protein n=2 Tax=Dioscorea alata TaxID=55571 RepID=A0ACB7VMM3_DIOAL|nr:Histone-lysine N-methyltransferase protein [Dioscorea alata]
MAFHVACPITCLRVCRCEIGNARAGDGARFLEALDGIEDFLKDPWVVREKGRDGDKGTVQVLVPKVVVAVEDASVSAMARRGAVHRQATAVKFGVGDFVPRSGIGSIAEVPTEDVNLGEEDQDALTPNILCHMCFSGENDGSEKAAKMLPCKLCNRMYHSSCLKAWAAHRDLFHWSSWVCPFCRFCEVCHRVGDPKKLMYCKRCDGAYHCYCQQPPHKNASHGPYLCRKHTSCHSCGSTVPGNGLSTRWFLGYTCCDACGRLFTKGNYCPVCLKVYRDSEMTPMVCCDVCQQWVHCGCDGISDEKYQQFQTDGNLQYKCAACRGDCYQVRDIDDAVQELWRRKDQTDSDLIASLRAAAGLPSQEEIFSISPFSDDEETGSIGLKKDSGRALKFSVKGLTDYSTKSLKDYGKNSLSNSLSNNYSKDGFQLQSVGKFDGLYQNVDKWNRMSTVDGLRDRKVDDQNSCGSNKSEMFSSPLTITTANGSAVSNNNVGGMGMVTNNIGKIPKIQIKASKSQSIHMMEDSERNSIKREIAKGTKLVIHLGGKNRNLTCSPMSEPLSCQQEKDFVPSDGNNMKPGKASDVQRKSRCNIDEEHELNKTCKSSHIMIRSAPMDSALEGEATLKNDDIMEHKQSVETCFDSLNKNDESSWVPEGVEDKNCVKGQRSKRKRSSMERINVCEDDHNVNMNMENSANEVEAKALQKLDKGAIGKRVEGQSSVGSWHKGVASKVIDGASSVSIDLDNGRTETLEPGKDGICLISKKQKGRRS